MAYAVNGFMYGVVTHIVDPSNFFLRLGSSGQHLLVNITELFHYVNTHIVVC